MNYTIYFVMAQRITYMRTDVFIKSCPNVLENTFYWPKTSQYRYHFYTLHNTTKYRSTTQLTLGTIFYLHLLAEGKKNILVKKISKYWQCYVMN